MLLTKHFRNSLIIGMFFCFSFSKSQAQFPGIAVQDSLALVDLFYSTGGPNWVSPWDLHTTVNTWRGVTLSATYTGQKERVLRIDLSRNNLTGQLPASLSDLTQLTHFSIWLNEVGGTIPASLGQLSNLLSFDISSNQVTGTIPATLGNLHSLQFLHLDRNKLSGVVPASLGNLSNLLYMYLSDNSFLFDDFEKIYPKLPNTVKVVSTQANIPVHRKEGVLSVTAGGTLSNNSYYWRNYDTFKDTVIVGDSTFAPKDEGMYMVTVSNSIIGSNYKLYSDRFMFKKITVYARTPYPYLITPEGTVSPTPANQYLESNVKGVAADGVSKVILVADSDVPISFSVSSSVKGSFSSLLQQDVQKTTITVEPTSRQVKLLYNAPDGYGTEEQTYRDKVQILAYDDYGNETVFELKLYTPPVVLVHGMWSSPKVWTDDNFVDRLEERGITNVKMADYAEYSSLTFAPDNPQSIYGRTAVMSAVQGALLEYRADSIVATQVDVVGHSLGGLMSRSVSQQPVFKVAGNYNKGYFHKLITIGTPHRGSPLGPLLWNNKDQLVFEHVLDRPYTIPVTVSMLFGLLGKPIGTVHRDFGIHSAGIAALGKTPSFKTYAITANYLPTQILDYTALSGLTKLVFDTSLDKVFASRCDEDMVLPTDVIVPLSSQRGYIASDTVFYGVSHAAVVPIGFTETNDPAIQHKVADLLLSNDPTRFSDGFPAPSSQPLDCNTKATRTQHTARNTQARETANPTGKFVQITAPLSGTTYDQAQTSTIQLAFQAGNGLVPVSGIFAIGATGMFNITNINSGTETINLPAGLPAGRHNLVLFCRDTEGNLFADSSFLIVRPSGTLDSIQAAPSPILLDAATRQQNVIVYGFFTNGITVRQESIGNNADGTVYATQKGNWVIKVSPDGLIQAMAPGTDTLIISNGGFQTKVPVIVANDFLDAQKSSNVIDFPAIDDKSVTAAPFAVFATAASGEGVAFNIVSGPATIQNDVITLTGTGTVTVQANAPGNIYFDNAQPVTRTFLVAGALPVTLINFTAKRTANAQVELRWETVTEQQNRGFEIERRLPGATAFTNIGFVQSKGQNGNSSVRLMYNFTDGNDYPGATEYRLKQTDLDGLSEYSPIRLVEGEESVVTGISVRPNPVAGGFYVKANGMKGIKDALISNMQGQTIMRLRVQSGQYIPLPGVVAGTYILTVKDAFVKGSDERVKIIIVN